MFSGCSGGNVTGAATLSPVPTSRPGRPGPLDPRARGAGAWGRARPPAPARPSPACCQAPVSLPHPRAELPRDTVRPLSECSLGGEVPPTCVCPVPPSAPHKGDLGSRGQPAPDTGAPRPGPAPPRGGTGTREYPSAGRTPLPLPRVSGVRYCPSAWRRGSARTHGPLLRGVPSPRLQKRRPDRTH